MIDWHWFLDALNTFTTDLWSFVGFPLLLVLGFWISLESGFVQIRHFHKALQNFFHFLGHRDEILGVHPLKAFFASVGGCIGIGNIIAVSTAIAIGGPGALFWLWIAAIVGMIIKYSEIYLGMKYRIDDVVEGHKGGPMYFLQHAYKVRWVGGLVCILLCLYGVEIYQFSLMVNSVSGEFALNKLAVTLFFLFLVFYATEGGIKRVAEFSTWIVTGFVFLYVLMAGWVVLSNIERIPEIISLILESAFTNTAATGGFAGASIWLAISNGISVGCYTGDVGVGYSSTIHSESKAHRPAKQASLAIVEIILDTMVICTLTGGVVLLTDVWNQAIPAEIMVQTALAQYFPYMNFFMPFFIFLLGYSTVTAYLVVGKMCAEYVSPRYGKYVYYAYALFAFIFFTFFDSTYAMEMMLLVAGALLILNLTGIFLLRKEIHFDFAD